MIKNSVNCPLDIIIMAGQSNAQGMGRGEVDKPYAENENIIMLRSESAPTYIKDENDKDVFVCPDTDFIIETACEEFSPSEGKIACLALPFAAKYAKEHLCDGRKLLIIKMGIGGTGFAHKQWGIGECLFERMIKMTDEALAMNDGNRIVAMLWHQGECDAFERPELSPCEREKIHYGNLSRLVGAVRERYGIFPFIAGGFVEEWSSEFRQETEAVMSAIRAVCRDAEKADFVAANDLQSNNQYTSNGDDIHFCRPAIYELADRYYKMYKTLQ